MLDFKSILIFSEKPKELADFYQKVFKKDPDWSDQEYYSFAVGQGMITIGPHDKVNGKSKNPERIMFNFETDAVEEEFERIKDLGAKVIAEPYSMSEDKDDKMLIATLADPDGNFFQLGSPWDEMDDKN